MSYEPGGATHDLAGCFNEGAPHDGPCFERHRPPPGEFDAARTATKGERAAAIRARLASGLERRLSDTGRTWSKYSTADPGATIRGWRWTDGDARSWSVSVDREGQVTADGPGIRVGLPPDAGDPVALVLAQLDDCEAFGAPGPTREQHDATIDRLRRQHAEHGARVHGGQYGLPIGES